jgi:hypothetical protein
MYANGKNVPIFSVPCVFIDQELNASRGQVCDREAERRK